MKFGTNKSTSPGLRTRLSARLIFTIKELTFFHLL